MGKGLPTKGPRRIFWSDLNVLYLDCGDSYMIVCVFQNSQNCTLKRINFIVYKLFLNKSDFVFVRVWIISPVLLFFEESNGPRKIMTNLEDMISKGRLKKEIKKIFIFLSVSSGSAINGWGLSLVFWFYSFFKVT